MNRRILYSLRAAFALAGLILINIVSGWFHLRLDLTENRRYTLSKTSVSAVKKLDSAVVVDILLGGSPPIEFKRLRTEAEQLLEEFASINHHIVYQRVNPLEQEDTEEDMVSELRQLGLAPLTLSQKTGVTVSQELVFPWALASYRGKTVRIPLLKNKLGASNQERINQSMQTLEYAFTDAFIKLSQKEKKKLAVLKGNGELGDVFIADFLLTLQDYYRVAPFTLDSVAVQPEKTLEQLTEYEVALLAKPTEAFTDAEKYVLDQYLLRGGKVLWLIDPVAIDIENLYNEKGMAMALPRDLNLDDLFFKYGIRLSPLLVNDLYGAPLVLASGKETTSQYQPLPWFYSPMVFSQNNHLLTIGLDPVRFQFAGVIDTLANTIRKTVLLASSALSKKTATPASVSLDIITQQPDRESYQPGFIPMAVLLEGRFTSVFKNRIAPFSLPNKRDEGMETAMIVISDGDIIKNELRNGEPLPLGYDKWTNMLYGNKDFLLNCIQYLMGDREVINIRNKDWKPAFLDPEKIAAKKTRWQLINIGVPLILLLIVGIGFSFYRRKKYGTRL